jgi:hypothetical protein
MFHVAYMTPLGDAMLSRKAVSDEVAADLYPTEYLSDNYNSEVGPGGFPPVGWNQPLLWQLPSLDPPSTHDWAGEEWQQLVPLLYSDFSRVQHGDNKRLRLFAAGVKSLRTNDNGLWELEEEANAVVADYHKTQHEVESLLREVVATRRRALARPRPSGSVAEGELAVTQTLEHYASTLAHALKRQLAGFLVDGEEIRRSSAACRLLLGRGGASSSRQQSLGGGFGSPSGFRSDGG